MTPKIPRKIQVGAILNEPIYSLDCAAQLPFYSCEA